MLFILELIRECYVVRVVSFQSRGFHVVCCFSGPQDLQRRVSRGVCCSRLQGRGFYVAVGGGFAEHVRAHMVNAIQDRGLNATLTDRSEEMGLLSVQGPNR